jgi:membrane protease YdiL (CAAX protease family)
MNGKHAPKKGWARVLIFVVPYFIIVGIFQFLGMRIQGLAMKDQGMSFEPFQAMVIALSSLCGTLIIVGLFRRFVDKESLQSMGFFRFRSLKDSSIGFVTGAVIMILGFIWLIDLKEITWISTQLDALKILQLIFLFIFVALAEELAFRGYILNNLMKSMDKRVALLVSSVAFSSLHFLNPDHSWLTFISITLAGILLGISYIYTKSLWLPIALHFSWNFFQGPVFGYKVSGNLIDYSIITQTRGADNLINGGHFGFEGSVLSVVFEVVAIVILFLIFRKKEADYSLNISSLEEHEQLAKVNTVN